jgi:hypothetical protein
MGGAKGAAQHMSSPLAGNDTLRIVELAPGHLLFLRENQQPMEYLVVTKPGAPTEFVTREYFGRVPPPTTTADRPTANQGRQEVQCQYVNALQCKIACVEVLEDYKFTDWDVQLSRIAAQGLTVTIEYSETVSDSVSVSGGLSVAPSDIFGVTLGVTYTKTYEVSRSESFSVTVHKRNGCIVINPLVRRRNGNIRIYFPPIIDPKFCGPPIPPYEEGTFVNADEHIPSPVYGVAGPISLCESDEYPIHFCEGDGYHV